MVINLVIDDNRFKPALYYNFRYKVNDLNKTADTGSV